MSFLSGRSSSAANAQVDLNRKEAAAAQLRSIAALAREQAEADQAGASGPAGRGRILLMARTAKKAA